MTPIVQHLDPFVGNGRGAEIRVLLVNGEFEVSVSILGHGDLRGGRVDAAELADFARKVLEAAGRQAMADWQKTESYVKPARNGSAV